MQAILAKGTFVNRPIYLQYVLATLGTGYLLSLDKRLGIELRSCTNRRKSDII